MKGTDADTLNADGSFSLPVQTSNLNYLLNGPCPLYILWIAPRDELRYVYARDEARRLYSENPDWMSQQTVTLRFTRIISPPEWDNIFNLTLREGQLHRHTHDILARSTTSEKVIVGIDSGSLVISDPEQLYAMLRTSGMAIVGAGYASYVLNQSRLLSAARIAEPRLQLVLAYANVSLGEYFTAKGHLAKAQPRKDDLSQIDQYFLQGLQLACDYQLGRIDATALIAAQQQLETQAPPELALQFRLDRLRFQHLQERDHKRRADLLREIEGVTRQIETDGSAPTSIKLQARLLRLFAQAMDANFNYVHGITRLLMRRDMRLKTATPSALTMLHQLRQADDRITQEMEALVQAVVREGHPLLIAEAIFTRAMIATAKVAERRFLLAAIEHQVRPVPNVAIRDMEKQLQQAIQIFEKAGCLEGSIRATLILADWYEIIDEAEKARTLAEKVVGSAQALGYSRHISHAQEHLTRQTDYGKMMALLSTPNDMDPILSSATDAEMTRFAEDLLTSMELPKDRIQVIIQECLAMRDVAREKMEWCRHLGLQQDSHHTRSSATAYVVDPPRWCVCEKLGYRSRIETPDWTVLIPLFKHNYCEGCPDRSPKQSSR